MTQRKLGTITLGQAPRADLTPILDANLPSSLERLHVGVLDGLSPLEIKQRYAVQPGLPVLVTRLLDESSVVMDKARVESAIQGLIDHLEDEGCTTILLLCTGKFHSLTTRQAILIEPEKVLLPSLAAMTSGYQVGMFVPLAEQIAAEQEKWKAFSRPPLCAAVSPYLPHDDALKAAAVDLAKRGAQILMTDCMGFVEHHRESAASSSGLPVVLSSALIAKLVAEVV